MWISGDLWVVSVDFGRIGVPCFDPEGGKMRRDYGDEELRAQSEQRAPIVRVSLGYSAIYNPWPRPLH